MNTAGVNGRVQRRRGADGAGHAGVDLHDKTALIDIHQLRTVIVLNRREIHSGRSPMGVPLEAVKSLTEQRIGLHPP